MVYSLAVTALGISDAFLMVPQVEVMFVEIPQWVHELTQKGETIGSSSDAYLVSAMRLCDGICTSLRSARVLDFNPFQVRLQ